ncbi:hypothetical protein CDAR_86341 [Caerostris darwini]|uniref:Uncharacterized protein n=1 Tax=Caerostris darwini TaxID=1538125 RepID=A0AAV4NLJ9_9ARAC|nr:hypothetical protein CDAR_86341 [Caerostris darwini]
MSLEKRVSSICLVIVCPRVGIGEELSMGYALSTVGFAGGMRSILDQETGGRKYVSTGTSCSGIPHYMELLMRLASFFSNKKNQQMSKKKEKSLITPGPF